MFATRVKQDSNPIDFSEMLSDTNADNLLKNVLEQIVERELKESPPYLTFPAIWGEHDGDGGPPPDDPLTLYLDLPFGADDSTKPRWSMSLVEILEDYLEYTREDTSYSAGALRIAEALMALAERIKAAWATGEENVRGQTHDD
jgi:hypothetical protein